MKFSTALIKTLEKFEKAIAKDAMKADSKSLVNASKEAEIWGCGINWITLKSFVESLKKSLYKGFGGRHGVVRDFGRGNVMAFVNFGFDPCQPSVSYTCTHDLDDISFDGKIFESWCESLLKEIFCMHCHIEAFDEELFESYDSWEYFVKYCIEM